MKPKFCSNCPILRHSVSQPNLTERFLQRNLLETEIVLLLPYCEALCPPSLPTPISAPNHGALVQKLVANHKDRPLPLSFTMAPVHFCFTILSSVYIVSTIVYNIIFRFHFARQTNKFDRSISSFLMCVCKFTLAALFFSDWFCFVSYQCTIVFVLIQDKYFFLLVLMH